MNDGVTMRVEGLAELQKRMRALGPKVANKVLRSALSGGANIIRKQARINAPSDTGDLQKAIRSGYSKADSTATRRRVNVFVKHKMKRYANNAANRRLGRTGEKYAFYGDLYYWRYMEFGTKFHKRVEFLQRAFESKKVEAIEVFKKRLWKGIEKAAREK